MNEVKEKPVAGACCSGGGGGSGLGGLGFRNFNGYRSLSRVIFRMRIDSRLDRRLGLRLGGLDGRLVTKELSPRFRSI